MSLTWPSKDPDETLDYKLDWVDRLAGDKITASTWAMPGGLTQNSNSFTDTTTTIWLAGGTLGASYDVVNHISTLGGRAMDQTVRLRIRAK